MGASFKVPVAPSVLVWARKNARLRPDEAAKAANVSEAVVLAWEAGTEQPTLAQLRKLGERYRRPLAVFMLPEPPKDWQAIHDFRSLDQVDEQSPALALAIREAHERRRIAVEMAELLGDVPEPFPVQATLDDSPEVVGAAIRTALGVTDEQQRAFKSADAALTRWRAAAESASVLVFGFSKVDVSEARGFSFSDSPLPAVAINSNDAPAARVFTIMHELAHVALRSGDVLCDFSETTGQRVEAFCNHVAGAVLVPSRLLLADPVVHSASTSSTWGEATVDRLSREFRVSREVILRRLLILGKTNAAHYGSWRNLLQADLTKYREKMDENEGGPKYHVVVLSRLGRLLPRLVLAAYDRDSITTSAASGYLGVKTKHFPALAHEVAGANGAAL